jgi:acyl-coenzyme A thioesterase PaaI-like protein
MVKATDMNKLTDMKELGEAVARSLTYSRLRGSSAFIGTPLLYPNGVGVVVRVDQDEARGFLVSDDGYAASIAETLGSLHIFNRLAATVAQRAGVQFEKRTMFVPHVRRDGVVGAVASIANASARAAERTALAVEQQRIKQSRELFDERLRQAFGGRIVFDVVYRGATGREWDFDAALEENGRVARLFALVGPAFSAVAAANLKLTDARTVAEPPSSRQRFPTTSVRNLRCVLFSRRPRTL